MFGGGKPQCEVERFNSLNPLCATIFHEWVNEFSKPLSINSSKFFSEQCFENEKLRIQLDNIYALSRKGRKEPGVEKAIEDIVMHTASALQIAAEEHGQDEYADISGMAASVPYIREIVFAFAPGLSSNGPSEAHEITVRIVFILTRMFANKTPKTFQFGVGTMCSLFGVRCDELRWSRLAENDQDKVVSMWLDGYEVRQVEQTKANAKVDDEILL